jgi:replication factor C small subunit
MELYTASTRFILVANYPSKIIDPIQSRCAFFRFTPLSRDDVVGRLRYIAEREGVDYDDEALDTIYEISEGDMRRAINVLQAASAMGKVTIETVYKVVGMARPREVREMLKQALSGDFTGARNLMRKLMLEYGLSGEDIVRQVHREIFSQEVNIPEELRVMIADYLGEIHFRLIEGSDDDIQLSALLAWLALMGKRLK